MGNIVDGGLDLRELKFLPSAHKEFPALLLQPGDLLFNRTNSAELVGKAAIYHGSPTPCSFASYLICVRRLDDVESGWICHTINSLHGRLWIASVVTQQVGQANVNGTKLKAFAVPLPPLAEQRALLSLMDELFSKCEVTQASVGIELRRLSRLRQSILKWAFEGKLVDQDPADEPAEKLLDRIRSERAIAAPTKKSRGRAAKAATGANASSRSCGAIAKSSATTGSAIRTTWSN
jgi:type I restriction enzyme S subunit